MKCRTHLVECLRRTGVEPVATGTVFRDNISNFGPMNAINYNSSFSGIYHSINDASCGGWTLDFKKEVTVTSYQIKAKDTCNYLSKWNIQFSNKNETDSYKTVDSQENKFPGDDIYYLPFKCTARFFRITGGSPLCQSTLNAIAFRYIKFFGSISTACTMHIKKESLRLRCLMFAIVLGMK